jgi:hypothetical protein
VDSRTKEESKSSEVSPSCWDGEIERTVGDAEVGTTSSDRCCGVE